jgi:hypothetical protein
MGQPDAILISAPRAMARSSLDATILDDPRRKPYRLNQGKTKSFLLH